MNHRSLTLAVCLFSTGCASHISMVRGEMPEETISLISDDLVGALSRTSYIESESVFLHESLTENSLHSAVDQSLRNQGWMVDVGNKNEGLQSNADLVLAYRAETFDSGRFGSYCLLINDEATTICREWDLVRGVPATLLSMTGISVMAKDNKPVNNPKFRVFDELVVDKIKEDNKETETSRVVENGEADKPEAEKIFVVPSIGNAEPVSNVNETAAGDLAVDPLLNGEVVWEEKDNVQ